MVSSPSSEGDVFDGKTPTFRLPGCRTRDGMVTYLLDANTAMLLGALERHQPLRSELGCGSAVKVDAGNDGGLFPSAALRRSGSL